MSVILVPAMFPLIFWNLCAHKISFVQHFTRDYHFVRSVESADNQRYGVLN